MFQKILEFLRGGVTTLEVDNSGNAAPRDIQIATAVLLLEVAGSDSDYAPEEVNAAKTVFSQQFSVADEEALEIFEQADVLRKETGRIDAFVHSINANFSLKQRQLVFAMIWRVVMADGNVEKLERRLATQMRVRLQLTEEQAESAKDLVYSDSV